MKYYEFREECEKRGLDLRSILAQNNALFDLLVYEDDDNDNEIIEILDHEQKTKVKNDAKRTN